MSAEWWAEQKRNAQKAEDDMIAQRKVETDRRAAAAILQDLAAKQWEEKLQNF